MLSLVEAFIGFCSRIILEACPLCLKQPVTRGEYRLLLLLRYGLIMYLKLKSNDIGA